MYWFYIKQLFEITMKRFPQGGKLRIFDCRGVARDPGQSPLLKSTPFEEDLMKAIGGHIKKGYEVILNANSWVCGWG